MLFRYVAYYYLKNILIILLGLSGLFAGLDFLMNSSALPSFNVKVLYLFLTWQEALNILYPLAIVFGGIWTVIAFIKKNTIASFYALGVSRLEILKPFFLVSLTVYLMFLALNFTSFATAKETASAVFKNQYNQSKTEDLFFKYNNDFVYIGALIPSEYKLEELSIFKMENGKVTETLTAKEAWYNIYEWVATDVTKKFKYQDAKGNFRLKIEKVATLHTLKEYQPKILESIYDGKALTLSESFVAKKLLDNQELDTHEVRATIYAKVVVPLFSIALLLLLIFQFPFHARYMNMAMTTTKAIGGTLFMWGVLFALEGTAKSGTILPELGLLLPIVLLWIYALYTLFKFKNKI